VSKPKFAITVTQWSASDDGTVWIEIKTEKHARQIRVAPDGLIDPEVEALLIKEVDSAVEAERERCAALAEEFRELQHGSVPADGLDATREAARQIAEAIRARHKPTE
jgi:hypothetical protein